MKMAASSQIALLVLAGIFAILGGIIGSPDGRLLALAIAGLCAVAVLFSESSRIRRILAFMILVAVIFQVIPAWRQHRDDRYLRKPGLTGSPRQTSPLLMR